MTRDTLLVELKDLRNSKLPDEQIYDVEVATNTGPTPEQLSAIVAASRRLLRAERRVEWADQLLKRNKARKQTIAMDELPKLMKDATMDECSLGNGWKVELDTLVTASVPSPDGKAKNAKERHEKGIAYLDNVAPDLVKHTVTFFFARGQEEQVAKLCRNVAKYKPPLKYEMKAAVHGQTLGKWVREQDKAGKAVDEEALGVMRIPTAELVAPKNKDGAL